MIKNFNIKLTKSPWKYLAYSLERGRPYPYPASGVFDGVIEGLGAVENR
jgi:hypothetical protein